MIMSLNITSASYFISTVIISFITWKTFNAWQKNKKNRITEAFLKTCLFSTLYMGTRAIGSIFFAFNPSVLNIDYIISHLFLGLSLAYLLKTAALNFLTSFKVNIIFYFILFLFGITIILNILYPNQPYLNQQTNIIDWGINRYIEALGGFLTLAILLFVSVIFISKAIQYKNNHAIFYRSILIGLGLLTPIFFSLFRIVFHTPLAFLIFNISIVIPFLVVLLGLIHQPDENKKYGHKQTI